MNSRKVVVWAAALAAILMGSGVWAGQALAVEAATEAKPAPAESAEGSDQAAPKPKSPIRISTIDFQDGEGGKGKLKLAGTAIPGTPLYLFFDEQPFAKVVADGEGKWGVEGDLQLDDAPHTFRAEQYDEKTKLLAGRAMISIGRAPKGATPPAQSPGQQSTP
jgi:hypothetical protein